MNALSHSIIVLGTSALLYVNTLSPAAADCAELVELSEEWGTSWVGVSTRGTAVPLRTGNTYGPENLDVVTYIHSRNDYSGPTVVSVKLTYLTEGNYADEDFVRVSNNKKKTQSFSVGFVDYQDFHAGGQSHQELRFNFHLAEGIGDRSIPFTTFDPVERTRQLLFGQQTSEAEETYRTYLLTMTGVNPGGSCVDFLPYFASVGAHESLLEFVDLRPHEAGHYLKSRVRIMLDDNE